jgi:hypothetical protein
MWSHSDLRDGMSEMIGQFKIEDVALVLFNDDDNATLLVLVNATIGWIVRCRSVGTIKCAIE